MKVYIVSEYGVVEYEEYEYIVGVYSSEKKAKAKIKELNNIPYEGKHEPPEYSYTEFEVDEDCDN